MGRPAKPLSERFLQKYRVDLATGCWLWTDHVDEDGYGIIWVGGKKRTKRAHRVSLELRGETIPQDTLVCHTCDTRHCVNPRHLYVGTNQQNIADMVRRGRSATAINPQPEELNGRAKIGKDDVRTIRSLHAAGVQTKTLQKRFSLCRTAVQRIVSGKAWAHIA